jgi:hypothetical protein
VPLQKWDILLLEIGFLAVLYAPWFHTASPRHAPDDDYDTNYDDADGDEEGGAKGGDLTTISHPEPPSRVVLWVVRFLFFKLMFMSGVVKVQVRVRTTI